MKHILGFKKKQKVIATLRGVTNGNILMKFKEVKLKLKQKSKDTAIL